MLGLLLAILFAVPEPPSFDGARESPTAAGLAGAPPVGPAVSGPNVILVTFDGVRRQEFFGDRPDPDLDKADTAELFPRFWSQRAAEGVVYGNPKNKDVFSVSNASIVSLPAYQSIFAGSPQPCRNNDCGRIGVETFPERFVRELGLPKEQVAIFASWSSIALAVEHKPGTVAVDAGKGGGTRRDAETWPVALAYLQTKRPRFLYISLNDSDDQGHAGDYGAYLASLRTYDRWLDELLTKLDGMGDYGKETTVLVTTDHGRGTGKDWRNHNALRPKAALVFLYARGPGVSPGKPSRDWNSHADIRGTVEKLFGIEPRGCLLCGSPLPDVRR